LFGLKKEMGVEKKSEMPISFADAVREFEEAWSNPAFTRFELPQLAVNRVLRDRYLTKGRVQVSRSMVWDMELKKAWDPRSYIPYVVSEGYSWGRHYLEDGVERFSRSSIQLGWLGNSTGRVLEDVFIDHSRTRILFLGRGRMDCEGVEQISGSNQPLFHVEHAAGGTEEDPLNLWRIVVLTEHEDDRFKEPFRQMTREGWLPGFLEIYIERDLGIPLSRRPRTA
jgi:hypothetical protein